MSTARTRIRPEPPAVLNGMWFFPRGGSSHVTRALAGRLHRYGLPTRLVSGSRTDLGPQCDARAFYAGIDVVPVDYTASLAAENPVGHDPGPGGAPFHASYEDRPEALDPVLARLDDQTAELHARAWERELARAGAAGVKVLHLNHLTPLNEAAARCAPDVPVVSHVHGTELLMLEEIAGGPPPGWEHAARWAERLRSWAHRSVALVAATEQAAERIVDLLAVPEGRITLLPNGVDTGAFKPGPVDRRAVWTPILGEDAAARVAAGTTLAYSGRFTAVKRVPLLLEAWARARSDLEGAASLVLIGGHPNEHEGEHPADAIAWLGLDDVHLAGWQPQELLPDLLAAVDALVLPSVRESFGQVLVEAMACGRPVIAVDAHGPATIVRDGETGLLIPPDDEPALAAAIVSLLSSPQRRSELGAAGRAEVEGRYDWELIAQRLAGLLDRVSASPLPE